MDSRPRCGGSPISILVIIIDIYYIMLSIIYF
jgi:hypothetical protein